jgi:hypothetical protein
MVVALASAACGGAVGGDMGGLDGSAPPRDDGGRAEDGGASARDGGGSADARESPSDRPDAMRPTGAIGCDTEPALAAREDVVFCEPWETEDWWRSPYPWIQNARLSPTEGDEASEEDVSETAIETDESRCLSGRCLRVHTPAGSNTGVALHFPLASLGLAPEHLFFRYYVRLGAGWSPDNCEGGSFADSGGKFPGFADVRVNGDPEAPDGQCGNGGAPGDGINCWSHRMLFRGCSTGSDGISACDAVPGAAARFGGYLYFGDGTTSSYYITAPWDSDAWSQSSGRDECETDPGATFCTVPASDRGEDARDPRNTARTYGVLMRDRWYAFELEIGMNTPGEADGIIRGWVDGELAYEKTNMIFRAVGHAGLHVRSFWLNVYHGGIAGACDDADVWLDQLVLANERVGTL